MVPSLADFIRVGGTAVRQHHDLVVQGNGVVAGGADAVGRGGAGEQHSNTDEIQRANMLDMANVGAEICASEAFLPTLKLAVRPGTLSDLDRCVEIEEACFR